MANLDIINKVCDMTVVSHKLITIEYKQMVMSFDIDKVRKSWDSDDIINAKHVGGRPQDSRPTETYFSRINIYHNGKNTIVDIQVYIDQELGKFLGIEYKLESLVGAVWNTLPMTFQNFYYEKQPVVKL